MKKQLLDVNGKQVSLNEVTYEDLIILYEQYIAKTGIVPILSEGKLSNNLPHGRIVNRILSDRGITYNDFLARFNKYSHVRTENKDNYDLYIQRFKDVCNNLGRTLISSELLNNQYGLPSTSWLLKNCPDKNVKTYADFVKWCGFDPAKHIWTKKEVGDILIALEKRLGRAITHNDITQSKTGFTMIVVNRLYGGLNNAKKELGLLATPPVQSLPFETYKESLKEIILDFKNKTSRDYISWRDIESGLYGSKRYGHKAYTQSFNRAGVDIHAYIRSLGCMMNPSGFASTYTFEDGERASSGLEHDISLYLRSLGLKYNIDYFRAVKYKTFSNEKSRIDCDYVIHISGEKLYIEVAGVISRNADDWHTHIYSSHRENDYRDRMIYKENIFLNNGLNYLIIFSDDMAEGKYMKLIDEALNKLRIKAA